MPYNHDHENEVTYFAKTNFRNQLTKFGIKTDDRRRHMYVIGKTGMGKSTLMENLFLSDIYAGHGCCYVDPHGDAAEKLINYIPSWRYNDVVYFNPADLEFPVGFNILEAVSESHKHLVASGMMGVFAKIWEGMWSSRMEYILNNTILALLDNPGQTLLGINRMMSDADYRKRMVGNVKDPVVRAFWLKEFASWTEKYQTEATASIQNKIGQFLSAGVIRNIVSQVKSTINVRQIMDENKIFIINLSKGRIGEDNSKLLGGLLITKIQLSAMERVDTPEEDRNDFYLYVDEFQNFAVESFAGILSEARKYRLCLTMAHQYIAQLTEPVRDAVFGNVGTMITFRVGSPDAIFMEQEFAPRITPEDIINLPKYNVYLKLLIDGVTSQPFSALTLPPIAQVTNSSEKIIKVSRERYAAPRAQIEEKVMQWSGMGDVSDEDLLKEADRKRKASGGGGGGGKPKFDYNCTRCDTNITLPVELDRSRPIYCDDCIKIVREERKSGKKPSKAPKKAEKKPPAPKPSEGELVEEKLPDEPSISLKAIEKKPVKQEETTAEKTQTPTTDAIEEAVTPEVPSPTQTTQPEKEPEPEAAQPSVNLLDAAAANAEPAQPQKEVEQPKPEPVVQKQTEVKREPVAKPAPAAKKTSGHEYDCSECGTHFEAPVKLDPSRPLYCGNCLEKARAKKREEKTTDTAAKAPEAKKSGHHYDCSECSTNFEAPVKLDPTRPLYCNNCLEKKREEKRQKREDARSAEIPEGEKKKRKRKRKRKKKEETEEKGTIRLVTSDDTESTSPVSLESLETPPPSKPKKEEPAPEPTPTPEPAPPKAEPVQETRVSEPKAEALSQSKPESKPKAEPVQKPTPAPAPRKQPPVSEPTPAPVVEEKPAPEPPKESETQSGILRSGQSVSFD